jgi:hypothetical protein
MRNNFKTIDTITMRDVKDYMLRKEPFRWGSSTAYVDGGQYVIMSYATVIAKINMDTNDLEYFDDSKYSNTTSRLQGFIKEVFLND